MADATKSKAPVDEFEAAGFTSVTPGADAAKIDEFEAAGFTAAGGPTGDSSGGFIGPALESGARSTLESGGVLAGGALGFKAGMTAAPFLGPAGPAAPLVGGIAGMVGGYYTSSKGAEALGLRTPEQMPAGDRPAAYFGQSFGGAIPFAVTPYGMAARGLTMPDTIVGRFVNQVVETARTRPLMYGTLETINAAGAATGAGVAEAAAPGQTGVRLGAEIAGGLLSPTLALHAANFATGITRRALATISPAGRETAAARTLRDLIELTGENPALIAKYSRDNGILADVNLTTAQRSGSQALAALQAVAVKHSAKFGVESQRAAEEGLDAIRGQIMLLTATGDPAALKAAGEIRSVYYRTLIQNNVDDATEAATRTVGKISVDDPAARTVISEQARDALGVALKRTRDVEKTLWNRVNGEITVGTINLQSQLDSLTDNVLPELLSDKTPKFVRDFVTRVTSPQKTDSLIILPEDIARKVRPSTPVGTNVKEMRQLRSELQELARKATNADDFNQARIYNNLAEAVLDDMDASFRAAGDTAYQEARSFSREMNDVFRRSFAGKALGEGKYGDRIAPELLLKKATASGGEAAKIQYQELEEATRFLKTRGFEDDAAHGAMLDAQERFLRLAASDMVNAKTGLLDVKRAGDFLKKNASLLERFPAVRDDMRAAMTSETARQRIEALAKNQNSLVNNTKALAKVVKDPMSAAHEALLSLNQEKQIADLARLTRDKTKSLGINEADAVNGLRAALLRAAVEKSSFQGGTMDIEKFATFITKPLMPGMKPPIVVMQEQGIMSPKHAKALTTFIEASRRIREASKPSTAIEVKEDVVDAAVGTMARMVGSATAGTAAKAAGTATPSLIVHGAGARFAEYVATKIPASRTKDVFIAALSDPDYLEKLIKKAGTPQEEAKKVQQMHAWLVQSGLMEPLRETRDNE